MAPATTHKTGGDDLDDGFELDQDLLANSEAGSSGSRHNDEEDGEEGFEVADGEYDNDDGAEDDERPQTSIAGAKRKAADAEDDEESRKAEKRRRKKEKEKLRRARKFASTTEVPSDLSPTQYSPETLGGLLEASLKASMPKATPLELSDLSIPQSSLLDPLSDSPASSEDQYAPLHARLKATLGSVKKIPTSAPRIIILCLSGLRCADVVRAVRDHKGPGEVAKLFAKHLKLAEQIKYLSKTRVSIAVGTPARVGKLLEEGAIKISKDTVLLLDVGHKDSKMRTLLTLSEVRDELWKGLFSGKSREVLIGGGARIGAF